MTKVEFDKWVDEMIANYTSNRDIIARRFGYKTYIAYNSKTNKIGIAKCHPDDDFNGEIGVAIAYARCKGYEVPKISTYKKFCELKNGDRFKGYLSTYLFIGKCYGHNNEITYAIQNIETLNIKQISTDYYNKEVEMVE